MQFIPTKSGTVAKLPLMPEAAEARAKASRKTSPELITLRNYIIGAMMFVMVFSLHMMSFRDGWNIMVRNYGILYVGMFIILAARNIKLTVPEISLYALFVIWAAVTGVYAPDFGRYSRYLSTTIQILFVIFALNGSVRLIKDIRPALLGFIVIAIYFSFNSFASGEVYEAADLDAGVRVAGLARNAIAYGFVMLLAAIATFYLAMTVENLVLKATLIVVIFGLGINVILSGSRSTFIGMLMMVPLFVIFHIIRKARTRLLLVPLLFVFFYLVQIGYSFISQNTFLGRRMSALFESDLEENARYIYIINGLNYFLSHPFTGVGLGNFEFIRGGGSYAHNDIVEILSTTGLFGFALYFPIYIVIWFRLRNLTKLHLSKNDLAFVSIAKSSLVMLLFMSSTMIYFQNPNIMSFYAILGGYAAYLESKYSRQSAKMKKPRKKFKLPFRRAVETLPA